MQALKENREQAREDSFKHELISKLFPEKAELDRLKAMEESKSAGEIKAQIAIHQLFSQR